MASDSTTMTGGSLREESRSRISLAAGWVALAMLLVSNLPLFVCMPLTADTALYDLQAQNLVRGGVQYRDIFETNLPGVVWLHATIRSLFGPSSEAMRLADFGIFAGIVLLLSSYVGALGRSRSRQVWTAVFLVWCYVSVSEWCHCQRDTWLLLPGLVGLCLRRRQVSRIAGDGKQARFVAAWGFAEGVCWGVGIWLKPFIAVPALCVWLAGAVVVRRGRMILVDALALLAGGLFIGAEGIIWMWSTHSWPYFLQTFIEWNPEYVAARQASWTSLRFTFMVVRLFPWYLLHVAAIPIAVSILVGRRESGTPSLQQDTNKPRRVIASGSRLSTLDSQLLSAFYLGWLVQAFFLQHLFDYIQLPGVLLAMVIVAGRATSTDRVSEKRRAEARGREGDAPAEPLLGIGRRLECGSAGVSPSRSSATASLADTWAGGSPTSKWKSCSGHGTIWKWAVAGFVVVAALTSPAMRPQRLGCWWTCLREGSTPEVRDRLSDGRFPNWRELEAVTDFLRDRNLRDGELTCYNVHLVHLYKELGLRPSTPFVGLAALIRLFPQHHDEMRRALSQSRQRYVVTELVESGMSEADATAVGPAGRAGPPPTYPSHLKNVFPWSEPVVFRSGRYLVHEVTSPVGRLEGRLPARSGERPNRGRMVEDNFNGRRRIAQHSGGAL